MNIPEGSTAVKYIGRGTRPVGVPFLLREGLPKVWNVLRFHSEADQFKQAIREYALHDRDRTKRKLSTLDYLPQNRTPNVSAGTDDSAVDDVAGVEVEHQDRRTTDRATSERCIPDRIQIIQQLPGAKRLVLKVLGHAVVSVEWTTAVKGIVTPDSHMSSA